MSRLAVRIGIFVLGAVLVLLTVAFCLQLPIATGIWPWSAYPSPGLSTLSYFFLASITAAISAPVIWIAMTNKLYAAAPGAINLTIAFMGIGIFMLQGYAQDPRNTNLLAGGILMIGVVISSIVVYLLGRNMPSPDKRPLPMPVRVSFYIFIVALILVGGGLILKMPNIMPWNISIEASVVYGWIFLGASAYFIFAVLNPRWENAAGQLIGFLAYDIVLILPFINHFSAVAPEHLVNLIIYMAVIVFSAILAIYYLLINKETRLQKL